LGNVLREVVTSQPDVSRTYNLQNQITSTTLTRVPVYDPNGNLTSDENGNGMTYDAWNRLVAYTPNGASSATRTFTYDALSRRIRQIVSGGSRTDLYFNQGGQAIEEWTSDVPTAQYVWSPAGGNLITQRDNLNGNGTLPMRNYPLQDPLGSVVVLWY